MQRLQLDADGFHPLLEVRIKASVYSFFEYSTSLNQHICYAVYGTKKKKKTREREREENEDYNLPETILRFFFGQWVQKEQKMTSQLTVC